MHVSIHLLLLNRIPVAGLMIRPEIRYDSALSGRKPFSSIKSNCNPVT